MKSIEQSDFTRDPLLTESISQEREVSAELAAGEEALRQRIGREIFESAQWHLALEGLYVEGDVEDAERRYFVADNLDSFDRGTVHDPVEGVFSVEVQESDSDNPEIDGVWLNVEAWVRGEHQHSLWFRFDNPDITDHGEVSAMELARIDVLLHPLRSRQKINYRTAAYLVEPGVRGLLPDTPLGKCIKPARKSTLVTKGIKQLHDHSPEFWEKRVRKMNREGQEWLDRVLTEFRGGSRLD